MIKCNDNGRMTCVPRSGKPKSKWETSDEAIENAKYINNKYPKKDSKLVAYKCTHCHKYHLTTKKKRIR